MYMDAKEACRLCLTADPNLSYIPIADHEDINEVIWSLSLKSDFSDETLHPAHICDQCSLVLKRFLKLKKKALDSEKILFRSTMNLLNAEMSKVECSEENVKTESKVTPSVVDIKEEEDIPNDEEMYIEYIKPEVEVFPCTVCDKSFHTSKLRRGHMLTHTSQTVKCPQCDKYLKEYLMTKHLRNVHTAKDIPCDIEGCPKLFKLKEVMRRHIKSVHEEARTLCTLCGESVRELHYHLQTCNKDNHEQNTCKICNKQLSCKVSLQTHVNIVHGPQMPETCEVCGKQVKQLASHMKLNHSAEVKKNMPCPDQGCGKMFRTKQTATTHYNRMHLEIKEQCRICSEWLKNLPMHLNQVHKQGKKHVCSHCGKIFYKTSDLKVHIERVHEGKRYSCPMCGKTVSKIKEHMRVVHGVSDVDKDSMQSVTAGEGIY